MIPWWTLLIVFLFAAPVGYLLALIGSQGAYQSGYEAGVEFGQALADALEEVRS